MRDWAILAAALALTGCVATAAPAPAPTVTMLTDRGAIVVRLAPDRAPGTVCNFLRYVHAGRYEGGAFFRTVVAETNPNPNPISVIQAATPAGSDDPGFGPIALERTRDTGLGHASGTISMARDGPDTATSSFFIVVEDAPALDFGGARNADGQGFAAFGEVVHGMDVVRAIHRLPAAEEQIAEPVIIRSMWVEGATPAGCGA